MRKFKYILILLLVCSFTTDIFAQFNQRKKTRKLYYTYAGPILSAGFNDIQYYDWVGDSRKNIHATGPFFTIGGLLAITTTFLQGDFSIEYMYNSNNTGALYHLFYSANGRYVYTMSADISFTAGLGVWFESAPSNKSYTGSAGLQLPIGIIYKLNEKMNLTCDIFSRYGSFGIGQNEDTARKFSIGLTAGILFKVGRI